MNTLNRRTFGKLAGASALMSSTTMTGQTQNQKPNVILVITDDQGYGDLGVHGNQDIQTPNLDSFAQESVHFKNFYVCPVCAPTRASLMTGRYNYRTGVVDTYLGRAMMFGDEVTMAQCFGDAGYKTGIFGKWHLGDNYPMRPDDQGFHEVLVHKGGGIGQPSDPPGNTYFDPVLYHNGVDKKNEGYCTDIFTDATIDFIEENQNRPFFAYLSTNAPHTPLQIHEKYVQPYLDKGLDETTAKVYGMITNLDDNMGRLFSKLDELNLSENTIFIFMTDNGAQQSRFNAGLRGRKGTVYEGGIRVPFYIRWPKRWQEARTIDENAAHIDVMPTLLSYCGGELPADRKIDGRNLQPLLEEDQPDWKERTLFFQWHRGDEPEPFRASAVREERYKLVNGVELYDILNDPAESDNIAEDHPEIVKRMQTSYMEWYKEVNSVRHFQLPKIYLGTQYENPVILTRQDWRGPRAGWGDNSLGFWNVDVRSSGQYEIRFRFDPVEGDGFATLQIQSRSWVIPVKQGDKERTFASVNLEAGETILEAIIVHGRDSVGVNYVDVKKV